ncbi:hypothetical protein [Magnetospirillum sp. ME-1]|uniref:hypothetical protein n=1 Tax=Magnetospirillum sp. ME-1 TaxID=1639348 RepID=UPI001F3DC853|nr:hypothetical protein [Magnetospirillum sp. ME-1]
MDTPRPSTTPVEVPPPKPPPPRPAPPPAFSPESLNGLNRDEVLALFGRPTSETRHAMGMTWRYRRGDCALSLVFYPEVDTEIERVLGYELERGKDAATCIRRLRDTGGRNGK